MKPLLSLCFHGSCAFFHFYAINWLSFLGLNILEMAEFFTVWTTFFHLIMNLVLAFHDVLDLLSRNDRDSERHQNSKRENTNSKVVEGILSRDIFFGLLLHLAIIMSSFTQFVFWMIYFIDREMILPESTNFPSVLNHMLHTFPLPLAVLALVVFSTNFPNSKKENQCRAVSVAGLKLVCFVGFAYLVTTLVIFELKGIWPYPFMFSFTRIDFLVFSLIFFLSAIVLCYIWASLEFKIKNLKVA